MKLRLITCGALLGFAAYLPTPVFSQTRVAHPVVSHEQVGQVARLGTVEGTVLGDHEEIGPWIVVIEGPEERGRKQKVEVQTDARGRFQIDLQPAIYTAYVKVDLGETGKEIRPTPFHVKPGDAAKIQLDPAQGYVYCTSSGKRVIPVELTHGKGGSRRALHRPKYDWHAVRPTDNKSLGILIQYCSKNNIGRSIQYKGAVVGYDTFTMEAESVLFDPVRYTLDGRDVEGVYHGQTFLEPRVLADFWRGKAFVDLTGGAVTSIKGRGTINYGDITFSFDIDRGGVAKFEYEDRIKGLKLKSGKHDCLIIASRTRNGLTFGGSAMVTDHAPNAIQGTFVEFTVMLQDYRNNNKTKDHFAISVPRLKNYQQSGLITSGKIEVSGTFKSPKWLDNPLPSIPNPKTNVMVSVPVRMKRP